MSKNRIRKSVPPDPFDGIGNDPEIQRIHARIIGPEDRPFLAYVEAQLREVCPPLELAMLIVIYLGSAARRLLAPAAQKKLQSGSTMWPSARGELRRLVASIGRAIEAGIQDGIDPYPEMAQKTVCYACSRLRAEIHRGAGNTPIVFGTVAQTLSLAKLRGASDDSIQGLFWSARQAAVRDCAFVWCRAIELENQQPKSLEYLVGLSGSADPFLCDQMRNDAKREDYDRLVSCPRNK